MSKLGETASDLSKVLVEGNQSWMHSVQTGNVQNQLQSGTFLPHQFLGYRGLESGAAVWCDG